MDVVYLAIAIYKPQDVRPIIQAYHGKDIPIEYAKKEAEAKQKHIEDWKAGKISGGGMTVSRLFGSGRVSIKYRSNYVDKLTLIIVVL